MKMYVLYGYIYIKFRTSSGKHQNRAYVCRGREMVAGLRSRGLSGCWNCSVSLPGRWNTSSTLCGCICVYSCDLCSFLSTDYTSIRTCFENQEDTDFSLVLNKKINLYFSHNIHQWSLPVFYHR